MCSLPLQESFPLGHGISLRVGHPSGWDVLSFAPLPPAISFVLLLLPELRSNQLQTESARPSVGVRDWVRGDVAQDHCRFFLRCSDVAPWLLQIKQKGTQVRQDLLGERIT